MLARARGADHGVLMQGVGQDDVDHLDFGIVPDPLQVAIRVAGLRRDAVLSSDGRHLLRIAADERDWTGVFALREGRQDVLQRQPPQPHDRKTNPL